MGSSSLIDSPAFWIAFGLAEIALPMVVPNNRWLGLAMLSVAAGAFAVAIGWSPSGVQPPSIAVYIPLALVGSVGISLSRRVATELSLRRIAWKMAKELEDWSVLARSNLPQFTRTAVESAEAARRSIEYSEKFGPRIVQLMKPLVKRDRIYMDLRDSFLRVPPKNTLDVASTAWFASSYFARYGEGQLPISLPRQWIDKTIVVPAVLCFGGACLFWLLLFLVAHK